MKFRWINGLLAMGCIVACGAIMQAGAQQTLFNVPSSDVLPKAKVYVAHAKADPFCSATCCREYHGNPIGKRSVCTTHYESEAA